MRPLLFALVLIAASAARAETAVPIVIVPFAGRCFDAVQLAEQVRLKVGELPVSVGAPGRGSRQEVRVSARGSALAVEVVARDAHGERVGSALRVIPDGDCGTALEVATLIVTRAALPLNWREPERSHPPRSPRPRPPVEAAHAPAPPAEPPPEAHPATAAATTPAPPPAAAPVVPPPPPPAKPSPPAAPPRVEIVHAPPEPGTIVLRTRVPDRRWLGELSAAAYGSFGLGRTVDVAGGELAVGFRHGRFGAAVRADLEGDWRATLRSVAGTIAVDTRRTAVAAEAHFDLALRLGRLRFAAGPTLPLYIVRPSGVPHPSTSIVPAINATVRVLYHLDLGRLFLTAGVACDVAFAREDLTVTGAGTVARTPWVMLGPLVALGVSL